MRALALISCATPMVAQDLQLIPPIDCNLGEICYIQNYVDVDQGPTAADFACGTLSYDGHDGIDFALFDLSTQSRGVDVLAAAAGQVIGTRDEMPDVLQGAPDAPDVTDRECGNGVVIRHPDGWETQYCHLGLGSVSVGPGDLVDQGAVIGQVGLSGQTEFPHVHMTVRHNGVTVDPFDADAIQACDKAPVSLWTTAVPYAAGGILSVGFSSAVPDYNRIKAGTAAEALTSTSPGLVLWGFAFGGRAGDEYQVVITGPSGDVLRQTDILERTQALFFRATGKRLPAGGWPAGDYTGTVTLTRNQSQLDSRTDTITLR